MPWTSNTLCWGLPRAARSGLTLSPNPCTNWLSLRVWRFQRWRGVWLRNRAYRVIDLENPSKAAWTPSPKSWPLLAWWWSVFWCSVSSTSSLEREDGRWYSRLIVPLLLVGYQQYDLPNYTHPPSLWSVIRINVLNVLFALRQSMLSMVFWQSLSYLSELQSYFLLSTLKKTHNFLWNNVIYILNICSIRDVDLSDKYFSLTYMQYW